VIISPMIATQLAHAGNGGMRAGLAAGVSRQTKPDNSA